jgi:predicted ATPase/DNA-binding XRE family transcriptional regulator
MAEITPDTFQTFGELMRYLRERAHLSQRDLAARVNYHYSYISRLENNQVIPDIATLKARFIPALGLENEAEWIARLLVFANPKKNLPANASPASPAREDIPVSLPVPFTLLLGRERETAALTALLQRDEIRLVTLVGPPGVGKTRLSIHAAQLVADSFEHGVIFVDLAPIEQAQRVIPELAKMLGIHEADPNSSMIAVQNALRDKHMLILMDNFEQVIQSAPQIAALLARSPRIKMLVTSREALRISAEQEFPLAPLSVPQISARMDDMLAAPIIQLFIQRAQAVQPGFILDEENATVIAEICSRLDGLPLAIELAAARINILNPRAMLERFEQRMQWLTRGARDSHAWRQTLRGALEWSYNLLSDEERVLLTRLSVFTGGWTLESAAAVCYETDVERANMLPLLSQLVEKSLVVADVNDTLMRYRFLDTIRHFAQEKFETSGERAGLRDRHLKYFANWAEQAETMLDGIPPFDLRPRAEAEHNNLLAALDWASQSAMKNDDDVRLAASVSLIWLRHSHFKEGLELAKKFLPRAASLENKSLYVKLLYHAAALSYWRDDLTRAYDYSTEAEHLARMLGDRYALVKTLYYLGDIYREMGDLQKAYTALQECVALCREMNHQPRLSRALTSLCLVSYKMEKHIEADAAIQEALRIIEQTKDVWAKSYALRIKADNFRYDKKFPEALAAFQNALRASNAIGDRVSAGMALANMSLVCNVLEDYSASGTYAESALAIFRSIGNEYQQPFPIRMMAYSALHDGDLERARSLCMEGLQGNRALNHKGGMLACLLALSHIEFANGDVMQAARLFAFVKTQVQKESITLLECDVFALEHLELKLGGELSKSKLSKVYKEAGEVLLEHIYQQIDIPNK